MAQDQVEEIKRKTDIVELISEYVDLKKSGRNFSGLCPFHSEKTPSFMVSPELQIYKCFGCNAGGDAYKFLMEYEKLDFPEALKFLADRAGVKLVAERRFGGLGREEKDEIYRVNSLAARFYHYLLQNHDIGKNALVYLKNRGIQDQTINMFNLGFAPDKRSALFDFLEKRSYEENLIEKAGLAVKRQNQFYDRFQARLMFPLQDHYSNIIGFSGRVLKDSGDLAKYINSPETLVYKKGRMVYGLNATKKDIKKENFVIVVEGEFDFLSLWQAGIKNVVAIKGTALTEDQLELLSRFCQTIYLALDSDFAGNQAAKRGIEIAQRLGVNLKVINLGDYKDPDEAVRSDLEFVKKAVREAKGIYDFLIDEAFSRFDKKTTEGKREISKTLSPILENIDDEIVKAHCIKKVAQDLGVSEEAVLAQSKKYAKNQTLPQVTNDKTEPKTRRELLEERLLKLVVLTKTEAGKDKIKELKTIIKTPLTAKILLELENFFEKYGKENFDISSFGQFLPNELLDFFATLVLPDLSEYEVQNADQEAENIKKSIEILENRETILKLGKKIEKLEKSGNLAEMETVEKLLAKETEHLTNLEESLN